MSKQVQNKVQALRQALNAKYMERSQLIDGMLTALISGQPLLMIGAPGTAKSAICQDICKSVQGNFFSWMLTKFTVPEELFGPLSLKGLEQDKYVRVTKGKLPECNIAFVDEVGKASSSISNTLLTILNEKTFYNGDQSQQVPMRVLFGASNEVPASEELSAFYDRFVLRFFVDYVHEEASARLLFSGLPQVTIPGMTLADVDALRSISESLPVPADVVDSLIAIRREIANEGVQVSDRKWVQGLQVAKAYATINGNVEVTMDDLDIICAIAWNTPDQIAKVRKIVAKFSNPMGEKIVGLTDAIREMMNTISKDGNAVEVFKKVQHAEKELGKLGDPSKNQKLAQAIDWVKAKRREIGKLHLGLED